MFSESKHIDNTENNQRYPQNPEHLGNSFLEQPLDRLRKTKITFICDSCIPLVPITQNIANAMIERTTETIYTGLALFGVVTRAHVNIK
jgi:hypothetical protein